MFFVEKSSTNICLQQANDIKTLFVFLYGNFEHMGNIEMNMRVAAIILCAGKGTRMNDDSQNKVCFECAGVPTIKRIVSNMKAAGVESFVIVVGHQSQSVMDCLAGIDEISYAYQKEQLGTGHAALCGLKALEATGYQGNVIIAMGDKIVAPEVIKKLLDKASAGKNVWSVQPVENNFSGGRVVTVNDEPYGVVEFADAAFMSLAGVSPSEYEATLQKIGLNSKKSMQVLRKAQEQRPNGFVFLNGRKFSADDILSSKYANAALYCFDMQSIIDVIAKLGADNAQGEIYITDALEHFARHGSVVLNVIESPDDMLTYSNKRELREIGKRFMRTASEFISDMRDGLFDDYFRSLYCDDIETQKSRYVALLSLFIEKHGDKKVLITRSPGRINIMGRHIDHRGGSINVIAADKDIVLVVSPREDDIVSLTNLDSCYCERNFSIGSSFEDRKYECWLDYLEDDRTKDELQKSRGDWSNYIKGAVLRAQFENDYPLCGMDIVAGGTIPIAAGLSSSSSMVVAVMEAVVALNSMNLKKSDFITLCGEGEWFVGSRGGAGDHAAMKCAKANQVVNIGFKPFVLGESAVLPDEYAIIVANSMIKAKKSEGSKDVFNAKIAAYEFAFMLLKKKFPAYDFRELRDVAKVRPYSDIYRMLKALPEKLGREEVVMLLPEYKNEVERILATHADVGAYDLRGVSLFGISECARSEKCIDLLLNRDYKQLGEMMKISHLGDKLSEPRITDEFLDKLIETNADLSSQFGRYACSTEEIDYLVDLLNNTDGVLGSSLVGAGLGGCVIALVEKAKSEKIISVLESNYYINKGSDCAAYVCSISQSSCALF